MNNLNLYVLPTSEAGLKDELFKQDAFLKKQGYEARGGVAYFAYWERFRLACEKRGITVHTADFWNKDKSRPDDVLLVQNHPGETFLWRLFYLLKYPKSRGGYVLARRSFLLKNYKFFKKRILWHAESPIATPYVYKDFDRISESGIYTKLISLARDPGGRHSYINLYFIRDYDMTSVYFQEPKDKFLVMINSNMAPHSLRDELYGERLRAIRYFCRVPGFDLYGYRWDKAPRHPFYFHYKKYVDKVWRGAVDDKLKTLSVYKFSLCFENCSYPGYISEKIFDCLAAGCVPIYLGAPDIESIVPRSCFIDFKKFRDYGELHRYLTSLTSADLEKYRNSILTFLRDKSNMKGMDSFLDEILS